MPGKGIQHVFADLALREKICIFSAHIIVVRRKLEGVCRFLSRYGICHNERIVGTVKEVHRFGILLDIIFADKINGIADFLFVLMEP